MFISYYRNEQNNQTVVDLGLSDSKVDLSYEEELGELLCRVLNGTLYQPGNPRKKNDALIRSGHKLLGTLENGEKHRSFQQRLKEEMNKVDLKELRHFTERVFLADWKEAFGCNLKQRFFAYERAYGKKPACDVTPQLICGYDEERSEKEENALTAVLGINEKPQEKFEALCAVLKQFDAPMELGKGYRFSGFQSFLWFYITEMIMRDVTVKLCPNCGRYFVPLYRSDTVYCNHISPQDKRRTCREYGAQRQYQEKLKKDEAMGLYRGIYMAKQMLARRNPDIPDYQQSFYLYKEETKKWKKEVKMGFKTQGEYIVWLKIIKNKKY